MATMIRDTIEREVVYPQSIERVWAALTEPEQMKRWFCSVGIEIDLRPGGAARFHFNEGSFRAVVETVEPPRHFAFRWVPGGLEDQELPVDAQGPLTLVDFQLESVADGTRLRLVESGFAAFDEARRSAAFGDNSRGWDECLANLETALRDGNGR